MTQPTNPAPAPAGNEKDIRMWNMLCHMSGIFGFVGPLIVWLIKKNEMPSVDVHGKAALNFQLTILIGHIVGMITSMICIGFFISLACLIIGVAFAIIAGLKANNGEDYKYPYSLNLVK